MAEVLEKRVNRPFFWLMDYPDTIAESIFKKNRRGCPR